LPPLNGSLLYAYQTRFGVGGGGGGSGGTGGGVVMKAAHPEDFPALYCMTLTQRREGLKKS